MIAAEYGLAVRARDVMRFIGMETAPGGAMLPAPASAAAAVPPKKLVRVSFTADEELYKMVLRSQQLLRHKYPNGCLEGVFKDALKLLIEKKDLGLRAEAAARDRARRKAKKKTG